MFTIIKRWVGFGNVGIGLFLGGFFDIYLPSISKIVLVR
jgi:hypothetical protein